jgi:hypothetical protein
MGGWLSQDQRISLKQAYSMHNTGTLARYIHHGLEWVFALCHVKDMEEGGMHEQ